MKYKILAGVIAGILMVGYGGTATAAVSEPLQEPAMSAIIEATSSTGEPAATAPQGDIPPGTVPNPVKTSGPGLLLLAAAADTAAIVAIDAGNPQSP